MSKLQDKIGELIAELYEVKKKLAETEAKVEILEAKTDNAKKLRPFEVAQIRKLWDSGSMTQREIADIYCINPATVSRTVRGIYN